MVNKNELNKNHTEGLRKSYLKPQVEIVPLLPKQTVLGIGCFTLSDQSGENAAGCGPFFENCSNT